METIKATLWIYRIALTRAAQLIAENWGVIFAPLAYGIILSVAGRLFIPLGFIGGMLLLLTGNACMSSGLYLIQNILQARRASLNDFVRGFTVYIWEIVRISFILWIPVRVASEVLYGTSEGAFLLVLIKITLYVLLNAVPELIYQSRASGLDLIASSYHFIVENWPEWFAPNLLITVAGYAVIDLLRPITGVLPVPVRILVFTAVFGLFVTYLMAFRGLLFSELNGSNRRARVYRYKLRD